MIDLLRADLDFHEYIRGLSGHTLIEEQLVRISTPYFAYMQATIRRDPVPPTHFVATAEQHLWIVKYLEDPTQHRVEDVICEHFRTLDVPGWDWLVKQAAGQIAFG